MTYRVFVALLVTAACSGIWSPPAAVAQPGSDAAEPSAVPRRADGRPDLAGVWDFRSSTPLERPAEAGEETVTGRAAAAATPPPRSVGAYNRFWSDAGTPVAESERTSLIVDPPDGRLPPLVPGAVRQIGSFFADLEGERPVRYRGGGIRADGPEDRGVGERCLIGFNAGPPVIPGGYNENLQIFQTSDYVAILHEMVHDARIVPLDGRPHVPTGIRQWMGDPRGHWDGDTLVIESTNFSAKTMSFNDSLTSGMGSGQTLHLTERLRRVDADTLEYEYTVNDPATFTRPFTAMIPMAKTGGPIFEYACHEGNYGLMDILAGARAEERAGAK